MPKIVRWIAFLLIGLPGGIVWLAGVAVLFATLANTLRGEVDWQATPFGLLVGALLAGGLSDRYGRKRMLMIALVLFGLASAACAFAPTAEWLIAARALLGIGGAFLIPYFCALFLLGIPIGWAEWAMGRYGGKKGFHSATMIMGTIGKGRIFRYLGVIGIDLAETRTRQMARKLKSVEALTDSQSQQLLGPVEEASNDPEEP